MKEILTSKLNYIITGTILAISITDLNSIMISLTLLATLIYWLQRNYGQWKKNKKE